MTGRVVCVGIAVLDQVWELSALPPGPGKFLSHGFRETGGGMAATAAVAIAALGGAALWHGRLGDDGPGATLLGLLARCGVELVDVVPAPGGHSPVSGVLVDAEGERMLAVFPGEGLPRESALAEERLDGAGAALADPRWPAGAERLFRLAGARGLPRVLDADVAAAGTIADLAPLTDHMVFSQRGLVEFTGIEEPAAGLAAAAGRLRGTPALGPAGGLGVTLGARGSLWWREGGAVPLAAPRIAARDTTGCGDVFHGAYALALAERRDAPGAARFATAVAALKAERGRGWLGMPDRAAVEARLAEGWA
ncbi:PfkB family carbohydrate kinase [Belnapia sp. F-4-1]|uniref:PfkB family carbohydrate kinase n=1 Tax=Belnapia sp. F-4-1 TaxID=1545443 RepID=UPI0005BAABE6|nr:PfkB family carbohydrate kinase [Belnapia sp. F-4-1]